MRSTAAQSRVPAFRVWVVDIDQRADDVGEVDLGPLVGHGHVPPAAQGLRGHEQVGDAIAHVLR